jgi:hypothetical protein
MKVQCTAQTWGKADTKPYALLITVSFICMTTKMLDYSQLNSIQGRCITIALTLKGIVNICSNILLYV